MLTNKQFCLALLCAASLTGILVLAVRPRAQAQNAGTITLQNDYAASPAPTPVDQKFIVKHGDIEQMEETLHTLNAQGITVNSDNWFISSDGKRFTICDCWVDK